MKMQPLVLVVLKRYTMRFKRILGLECELADYRIQSITQGQDALAHVHVELKKVVTKYQVSELRKTYWKRRRAYVHAAGN